MRANQPAKDMQESISLRRGYILDALHYRRHGNRQAKRVALNSAYCEKINQRYFLGDAPF